MTPFLLRTILPVTSMKDLIEEEHENGEEDEKGKDEKGKNKDGENARNAPNTKLFLALKNQGRFNDVERYLCKYRRGLNIPEDEFDFKLRYFYWRDGDPRGGKKVSRKSHDDVPLDLEKFFSLDPQLDVRVQSIPHNIIRHVGRRGLLAKSDPSQQAKSSKGGKGSKSSKGDRQQGKSSKDEREQASKSSKKSSKKPSKKPSKSGKKNKSQKN